METKNEESRIAVIGIVVEQEASVDVLNETLHEYREYIIGRMGIPYREKKVNIISIAIDAPQDKISALSGKIGNLPGIQSKTVYSGVVIPSPIAQAPAADSLPRASSRSSGPFAF